MMTTLRLRDFFKTYDRAGILHKMLGPKRFVADDVLITRSGAVGMVVSLQGLNYETASQQQIDKLWKRYQAVQHKLGPHFRTYGYFIKRIEQRVPTWTNPAREREQTWIRDRAEHLRVACIKLFLVVLYEPKQHALLNWWHAFSLSAATKDLSEQLSDGIEILRAGVEMMIAKLSADVHPSILSWDKVEHWLSNYYNPDLVVAAKVPLRRHADDISYLAANTPITNDSKYMIFGNPEDEQSYKLRAWVLKDPPERTLPEDRSQFPFLLRELQNSIDTNIILCTEWKAVPLPKSKANANTKRRIRGGQTHESRKAKQNPEAIREVKELGHAIGSMRKSRAGRFALTILLFDHDAKRLRRACVALDSIHWDGILVEEYSARERFSRWLATVPGNHAFNLHRCWLTTLQYSELSPLFKLNEGNRHNTHLHREYQSVFETSDGSEFCLSLHEQGELAHGLTLGPPRSGKTALMNQLAGDARAKYGAYVWIIDLNRGYKALMERLGGHYISHDLDDWKLKIAPFRLEETEYNFHFLHRWLRMAFANEGHVVNSEEDADLWKRVHDMYAICPPHERSLSWLNQILCPSLKGKLHRWIGDGPYACIFDNTEDEFQSTMEFVNYDLFGLNDHQQVRGPLRFYYFHRMNELVQNRKLRHIPKCLIVDEGWSEFLDWIRDAIKSWPKQNAWVLFVAHAEGDLKQSAAFYNTLRESCPNLFFLPSPGADVNAYAKAFPQLTLRRRQIINDMVQPEFLYVTPTGAHKLIHRREPNWARQYDAQNKSEEVTQ